MARVSEDEVLQASPRRGAGLLAGTSVGNNGVLVMRLAMNRVGDSRADGLYPLSVTSG